MPLSPIAEVLEDLRAGRMVVMIDDEQRENEGDLVCAAQYVTPEIVNFMTKHARGVLCVALAPEECDRLELAPQSPFNTAQLGTAFTVTVDAHRRFGVTTGVSAADRATTIRLLADPTTRPDDLSRPGHINPLRAREGGVLVRTGQTEGSVDLCKLAGLRPAAVIIEIMNDDGTMARLPQLREMAAKHGLKICSVADTVAYRLAREKLVERVAEAPLETAEGTFHAIAFRSMVDPLPHLALVKGRVGKQTIDDPVLVRVHAQNVLGDVFGDLHHPSDVAIRESMRRIEAAGEGAILYLRQDPRGQQLIKQIEQLRETHTAAASESTILAADSSEAAVNIGIGSQILRDLGIRKLRLLTNHPQHYHALQGFGLSIDEYAKLQYEAK